jgi:hypothetical protein
MKIERNVQMPPAEGGPGRKCRYPFSDMAVGESLFAKDENSAGSLAMAAYAYAHRSGKKFSARKADGGCRVWRVS